MRSRRLRHRAARERQAEKSLARHVRSLHSRIDRLLAGCDDRPKLLAAPKGRAPPMPHRADQDAERLGDAGTMSVIWNCGSPSAETCPAWDSPRRGWKAKQGPAVMLQGQTAVMLQGQPQTDRRKLAAREPPALEVSGRAHSDPGGDEQGIRATLDVYHIGQQGGYREASSLISRSQQLAQQFFGVPTQYKLRHGAEMIRAARVESAILDEEESMAEGSGDTGRPLVQAIVPKLCLDCGQLNGAETSKLGHRRPQSARFAPSVPKSSKDRPQSARLTQISRLTSSNSTLQSTNMSGQYPSENPGPFIECEGPKRSPRSRVSRAQSFCNSIARVQARLKGDKEKGRWSGSDEPPRLDNRHAAINGQNGRGAESCPSFQRPPAISSQAGLEAEGLYINPYWKIGFEEEIQQRQLASVGAASEGRRNLNKNALQRPSPRQQPPMPHQRNLSVRARRGSLSLPPRPAERSPSLNSRIVTPRRLPSPTLLEEMSSAEEKEFEYLTVSTSPLYEVPVAKSSSRQQVTDTYSKDSCLSVLCDLPCDVGWRL